MKKLGQIKKGKVGAYCTTCYTIYSLRREGKRGNMLICKNCNHVIDVILGAGEKDND